MVEVKIGDGEPGPMSEQPKSVQHSFGSNHHHEPLTMA
jgi:hypothetical protein